MSDDPDKPLSFKERQQLFNVRLNVKPPPNDVAKSITSPRLPPRNSVSHGTPPPAPARPVTPSRDMPPPMPPRKQSTCAEVETCEDIPYRHVSERRHTRRAVRIKKSPSIRRSPSPSLEKDDTIKRAPSPKRDTIKRRSPSPNSDTITRLPKTAPPQHSNAAHRQSMPEQMAPPDLPPRRNSYDDRLNVNPATKKPARTEYHYARTTPPLAALPKPNKHPTENRAPPTPPSGHSPYSVRRAPNTIALPNPHSAAPSNRNSQYIAGQPPPVNLASHPRFQSPTKIIPSRPAPSPTFSRSPNTSKRGIPGGVPPPIPSSLPPPLIKLGKLRELSLGGRGKGVYILSITFQVTVLKD